MRSIDRIFIVIQFFNLSNQNKITNNFVYIYSLYSITDPLILLQQLSFLHHYSKMKENGY